ncbi:MAG: hypothetical protein HeimC3_51420 [Candidatus Heimdallarchaeota archaeon LC_3]|nr:MAG: hypothetical protein HeimC3_51420 [Candidatus Heimdallarchaeota archaeon LC_3]
MTNRNYFKREINILFSVKNFKLGYLMLNLKFEKEFTLE